MGSDIGMTKLSNVWWWQNTLTVRTAGLNVLELMSCCSYVSGLPTCLWLLSNEATGCGLSSIGGRVPYIKYLRLFQPSTEWGSMSFPGGIRSSKWNPCEEVSETLPEKEFCGWNTPIPVGSKKLCAVHLAWLASFPFSFFLPSHPLPCPSSLSFG